MSGKPVRRSSGDYERVIALVREIGARTFEPIPWDQIAWHSRADQSQIQRLWAWLISKTLKIGHWSPYAITKRVEEGGEELHIENAAKALGMDEGNARRTWKQGVEMGLWRNGTKEEGKRRLYICGKVAGSASTEKGEDKANEKVCTDLLPPYILKKIKDWPEDRRGKFLISWARRVDVRDIALRELVAGARDILDDQDTAFLTGWELDIKRQEHPPKGDPEEVKARLERAKSLKGSLSEFVQTVENFVQTRPDDLYEPKKENGTNSPTLLPETSTRQRQDERAVGGSIGTHVPADEQGPIKAREHKQLPIPPLEKLKPEEQEAANLLFSEFRAMQRKYPRFQFSKESMSPQSRNDQLLVYRILSAVGAANAEDFTAFCFRKLKELDRNALGKQPSLEPELSSEPRSFGLVLHIAKEYGRALDESARASRAEKERMRLREMDACRALLADPNEPEEHKEHYRKVLAAAGGRS